MDLTFPTAENPNPGPETLGRRAVLSQDIRDSEDLMVDQQEEDASQNPKILEAMTTSVVLREIFKLLGLTDLVNLRLVCGQWNEVVCSVIIAKNMWKLVFSENGFDENYSGSSEGDIIECIQNSGNFPCTSLQLQKDWEKQEAAAELLMNFPDEPVELDSESTCEMLGKCTMFQFVKIHGINIKELAISLSFINSERLVYLLLLQLQNLASLRIHECVILTDQPITEVESKPSYQKLLLPSLKCITYNKRQSVSETRRCSHLLEAILQAAPKLQEIKDFSLNIIDEAIKTGKIDAIKKLEIQVDSFTRWSAFREINIEWLDRLAKAKPQLHCLNIGITFDTTLPSEIQNAFSEILKSSQHSLKKLEIPAFYYVPELKLPPNFPNLRQLSVANVVNDEDDQTEISTPVQLFSSGYTSQNVFPFPNLVHLGLYVEDLCVQTYVQNLEDFSWNSGSESKIPVEKVVPFPTVQILEIQFCDPGFDKGIGVYLESKFPNLKKVILNDYDIEGENNPLSKGMYYLPSTVECIELIFSTFTFDDFELDSFFLGIDKTVCKKLFDQTCVEERCMMETLEKYKTSPGIEDLINLKQLRLNLSRCDFTDLKLFFENSRNRKKADSLPKIITPLSWTHGFQKLPDLKVEILYDHHDEFNSYFAAVLKPMEPFVKITHFQCSIEAEN